MGCRCELASVGYRWWSLGETRYRPSWFRSDWWDVFLDAEVHYRNWPPLDPEDTSWIPEHYQRTDWEYTRDVWRRRPPGGLVLDFVAAFELAPQVHRLAQVKLSLELRSLYRATYQLRLVEVDGVIVEAME